VDGVISTDRAEGESMLQRGDLPVAKGIGDIWLSAHDEHPRGIYVRARYRADSVLWTDVRWMREDQGSRARRFSNSPTE